LRACDDPDFFPIPQGMLPRQHILWQNFGICVYSAEQRLKTAWNIAITVPEIFSGNILATFYSNTMTIGPVTPEITTVINALFSMRGQNQHISPNISTTTKPTFTNVSALVSSSSS